MRWDGPGAFTVIDASTFKYNVSELTNREVSNKTVATMYYSFRIRRRHLRGLALVFSSWLLWRGVCGLVLR